MTMTPNQLLDRIDRALSECDATRLPHLASAGDHAGDTERLAATEIVTELAQPPASAIPVADASSRLRYEPSALEGAPPKRRIPWPWRRP